MENDNFYIVLPSNVRADNYMQNKTSHFLTPLPKPLELNTHVWEVSLAEVSYPHTWYNIHRTDTYIDCINYSGEAERVTTIEFNPGHYTGSSLAKQLTEQLKRMDMKSNFNYEESSNKMRLELHVDEGLDLAETLATKMGWWNQSGFYYPSSEYAANITFDVNPNLREIFPNMTEETFVEMRDRPPIYHPRLIYPEQCVNLGHSTQYLYIYCNLISEIMVGDIYAKLMRTVSTRSEDYGQYVTRTFASPHYMPLASSFENFIEISIRDDEQRLIAFESGKVIVTLHFRKRK